MNSSCEVTKLSALQSEQMRQAFGLLQQLRPHLKFEEFIECCNKLNQITGYDAFIITKDGLIIGFASFEIQIRFSFGGRFLYIADLVVHQDYRGKGYGKLLMQHIEKFSHENQLSKIVLESGMSRLQAHLFYENLGYIKESYSFRKKL